VTQTPTNVEIASVAPCGRSDADYSATTDGAQLSHIWPDRQLAKTYPPNECKFCLTRTTSQADKTIQ
jgi:hypothetical protein